MTTAPEIATTPARRGTLGPDEPLTTAWASSALARLYSLGITQLCDWIMEPGRYDRVERPGVERIIREVLALTPWQMGYDVPQGERGGAALARQKRATRAMLLLRWSTDPVYFEGDPDPLDPDWE